MRSLCFVSLAATFGVGFSVVFYFFLVGGEEKNMFCIHSRPKRVVLVCASRWGTVSTNECRSTKRYLTTALSHVHAGFFFHLLETQVRSLMFLAFLQTLQQQSTPHLRVGTLWCPMYVTHTCVVINHVVW